jgi:hypothetical protein
MSQPFLNINDQGAAILAQRPGELHPGKHNYRDKPVKVAVHHDLTIELHGDHFSASTKLSPGDALGLITMLSYAMRDHLEVDRGVK